MSGRLFGRDEELAAIDHSLAATAGGVAALVLEGQAGIGKTALWRETLQRAAATPARVLIARPAEPEARLAFAALGDLLGEILDEVLPSLPEPQARALRVALLLEDPAEVVDPRGPATALLRVIRTVASQSPVVIAIDDVQWLDASSAEALAFVVRRLGDLPVRLLLTRRALDDDVPPLGLGRALPEDRLHRVRLGPLSLGAIHSIIHVQLGVALPRPTLLRVHEMAAGNAFFALEVARALMRHGLRHDDSGQLPVPQTLRALIGVRLGELSRLARATLVAAAAMSEPVTGILASIAGDRVADDLEEAAERGIIEIGPGGRITFAHPLLASVLYEDASPAERRLVHADLARAVDSLEERARHLALAADGPDPEIASLLDDAARQALARGAPEAAAELSAQARRLTPPERAEDFRHRGIEAARLYLHGGDTARARQLIEQLLPSCPSGEARATALYLLGIALGRGESHRAAVRSLERARVETEDARLQVAIAASLTVALMQSGDIRGAAPHARAAADLADRISEPGVAAVALSQLALVEFLLGNGLRRDLLDRVKVLCATTPHLDSDVNPPGNSPPDMATGTLLKWADEFDEAREQLAALRRRAIDQHEDGWLPPVLFQLAELECWRCNWEAAAGFASEARRAALRAGSESFATLHLSVEALSAAQRGRVDESRARAAESLDAARRTANRLQAVRCHAALGGLELSLGDPASAVVQLEQASQLVADSGYADPGVFRFLADHVEALIALERLGEAEATLEPFEEQARAFNRPWARATAARCRALLHASGGDLEGALEVLEDALQQHERVDMPIERGRTLLIMGTVLRRAKRRANARHVLGSAAALFDELDATQWATRAREELGRISGRASSGNELTATERRIAELVADGLSNKEIARALFVTPKTVETQLSRIYAKVGVRSRVELARRMLGAPPTR